MSWRQTSLLDQVAHPEVLELAFDDVRRARGAPGVDGVTLERFAQSLSAHLTGLSADLRRQRFEPLPVKRLHIPKPDGGSRMLGIPCVRDRVVARAVQRVLTPSLEKVFCPGSFAYRPHRNCRGAIHRVLGLLRTRGQYAALLDIRDYFPSVHQGLLLSFLDDALRADPLVWLIERLLATPVAATGPASMSSMRSDFGGERRGLEQGSPLSPLLANVYLHPWDKRLTEAGVGWVRYCDNAVLVADSPEAAAHWLEEARADLGRLHLQLNDDKTRVVDGQEGFPFLGFHVRQQGIGPELTSLERLGEKLLTLAGEDDARTPSERVTQRRILLQGWLNYYASLAGIPVTDGYTLAAALELVGKRGDLAAARGLLRAELPLAADDAPDPEAVEQIRRTLLSLPALRSLLNTDLAPMEPLPQGFPATRNARATVSFPMATRRAPEALAPSPAAVMTEAPAREEEHDPRLLDASADPWLQAEGWVMRGDFRSALLAESRLKEPIPAAERRRSVEDSPLQERPTFSEEPRAGRTVPADAETSALRPTSRSPLPAGPPGDADWSPDDVTPPQIATRAPSRELLALLKGIFPNPGARHARMWVDRLGRRGYAPVPTPLDDAAWSRHLSGEQTLALPLAHKGLFHAAVLDIDIERPLFEQVRSSPWELSQWLDRTHAYGQRLLEVAHAQGLHALLEDSGQKGRHVWCFLEPPAPAREVFALLKRWQTLAGPPPEGIHVDLMPADSSRPPDGSPLITLPLGIHLQSGRRSRLLNFAERWSPHHTPDQPSETALLPLLRSVRRWSLEDRERLLSSPGAGARQRAGDNPGETAQTESSVPEARHPRVAAVLAGCPVTAFLLQKTLEVGHLNHRERLVLLHVFGHLDASGAAFLHAVMARCANYDPRITDRYLAALKPSPVSCSRVREWLPEVTRRVVCACAFKVPTGLFPSPLLHLDPTLLEEDV